MQCREKLFLLPPPPFLKQDPNSSRLTRQSALCRGRLKKRRHARTIHAQFIPEAPHYGQAAFQNSRRHETAATSGSSKASRPLTQGKQKQPPQHWPSSPASVTACMPEGEATLGTEAQSGACCAACLPKHPIPPSRRHTPDQKRHPLNTGREENAALQDLPFLRRSGVSPSAVVLSSCWQLRLVPPGAARNFAPSVTRCDEWPE